jgi:hypothetical protein
MFVFIAMLKTFICMCKGVQDEEVVWENELRGNDFPKGCIQAPREQKNEYLPGNHRREVIVYVG